MVIRRTGGLFYLGSRRVPSVGGEPFGGQAENTSGMRPLFLVILLALVSVLVLGALPFLQARRHAAKGHNPG
jgi:hypothetical protein